MNRKLFKEMCLTFLLILGMAVLSRGFYGMIYLMIFLKGGINFIEILASNISSEAYRVEVSAYLIQIVILTALYGTKAKNIAKKALYYFTILTIGICIFDIIVCLEFNHGLREIFEYTIWKTNFGQMFLFSEAAYIVSVVMSKSIRKFAEKYPNKIKWYEKNTLKYVSKKP